MADAARKNRRRKINEVITIDDDDSADQKPKIGNKDEESALSREVVELREKLRETEEKLLKSEDKFQRLCRIAREHELRAERAENLLDSKRGVLDAMKNEELEKKVSSLTNQLEEERKASSERMADLTNKLAEERSRSMRWVERENNMSHQLEAERRSLAEFRSRNDELTSRLTKFDVFLAQLQQPLPPLQPLLQIPAANEQLQQQQLVMKQLQQIQEHLGAMHKYQNWISASAAALVPRPVERPVKIYDIGHSTNILQMLRSGTPKSVELECAVGQLRAKWIECGEEKWKRAMMGENSMELFECSVCDKNVPKGEVLGHFLSQLHIERVRVHGAAVSLAAYQHWFRLLQQAATTVPETAPAAAAPSEANCATCSR